jgi:hypothetical protein
MEMAKAALAMAAFVAVFAVLVLVAGSIPPQPTTRADSARHIGVDRGHVIELTVQSRRASGASSAPHRTDRGND